MYLGPHDFQAQSAWFEDSVNFATRALWFEPYGILACELNREGLLNGTVSVTHARGIFPDGLLFHMGEFDPLPEPRQIADFFPPASEHMLVYLAIPAYRHGQRNIGTDEATEAFRYEKQDIRTVDENTGLDEKVVPIARKTIRILFEAELNDSIVRLPIARIRRDHDGRFIADEEFIPPCLRIAASSRLLMICERLLDILAERSAALSTNRDGNVRFSAALTRHEVASFWFRHSLNAALPLLRHVCFTQQGHPEELFRELSRLAGALCTFGLGSSPAGLPAYDHENLQNVFDSLDRTIRAHLDLLDPPNRTVISLQNLKNSFYSGDVKDIRCLHRARWLLGVRSPMDEASLISQIPKVVKLCSARFVGDLVRRALPGLALRHVPAPPAEALPRFDMQYFAITREGPCWATLVDTKQVGIYVPGEIPNPELELIVLLEI
jgi:type VI secretion system protein ImpJ